MKIGCVICDRNGVQCQKPLDSDHQYLCQDHLKGMGVNERQRLAEVEKLTLTILNTPNTMDAIKAAHLIGLHLRQIQKVARQVEIRGRFPGRFATQEHR